MIYDDFLLFNNFQIFQSILSIYFYINIAIHNDYNR